MEPRFGDLPATRWEWSSPESYVLMHGPSGNGAHALKLALLELVASRALSLTEVKERALFSTKHTGVLAPGSKRTPPERRPLRSLLELLRGLPQHTYPNGVRGVPVADFTRAVRTKYKTLDRYVQDEVLPMMLERGHFTAEAYRVLWVFPATRYFLTPEGEAAKSDLESRLALARERLPGWIGAGDAQAFAFIALAGSSVLLLDELYPDLQRLSAEMAARQQGGDSSAEFALSVEGNGSDDREHEQVDSEGLESGSQSFDFLPLDFDLAALDTLESDFSAIDSGVDSGDSSGGDGDGDGGNGD